MKQRILIGVVALLMGSALFANLAQAAEGLQKGAQVTPLGAPHTLRGSVAAGISNGASQFSEGFALGMYQQSSAQVAGARVAPPIASALLSFMVLMFALIVMLGLAIVVVNPQTVQHSDTNS